MRSIGKSVEAVEVGDPVLLSFYCCSSCPQCEDGHPAYCEKFAHENYIGRTQLMSVRDGNEELSSRFFGQSSFAQLSVVDKACVTNAKDLLHHESELELFAPLGCGFQTGMGAIQNITKAGHADTVMIIGLGAVGMGALMVRPSFLQLFTIFKDIGYR